MYQRVFYGEVTNEKNRALPDLNDREKVILVSLVFVILWMGIYPQTFLRRLDSSVAQIVQHVERGPEYFGTSLERKP
jgi:NADH-quinone oxidoreductase subunit M